MKTTLIEYKIPVIIAAIFICIGTIFILFGIPEIDGDSEASSVDAVPDSYTGEKSVLNIDVEDEQMREENGDMKDSESMIDPDDSVVTDGVKNLKLNDGKQSGIDSENPEQPHDNTLTSDPNSNTEQMQNTSPESASDSDFEYVPNPAPAPLPVPVSNISMSIDRTTTSRYKVGDTGSVAVVVFPSNATDKGYQLTVNDPSILTVSQNGQFTAVAYGTAVITATSANGVRRDVAVTVLDMDTLAQEVIRLTNEERSKKGASSLSVDNSLLSATAVTRAREIITSFSHMRPDGRKQSTVYEDLGGSYNGRYMETGENIAAGHISSTAVVTAWMNSIENKANILNTQYTHIGVSVDMDSSGKLYWVQIFYG